MLELQDWPLYAAPPGSRYTILLVPENASQQPNTSIMRQYMDARPNVAVTGVQRVSLGVEITLRVFKDQSLASLIGHYVNDGDQFWKIENVWRIDPGATYNPVGVTIARLTDAILDTGEREGEELKRTAAGTAEVVREQVAKGAIVTLPLLGIALGLFLFLKTKG